VSASTIPVEAEDAEQSEQQRPRVCTYITAAQQAQNIDFSATRAFSSPISRPAD